jgi:beta-glucosidase
MICQKTLCSNILKVAVTLFFLGSLQGAANTSALSWDVDKNNEIDALSDGLLILRYSFGLSNESLTNNAIASDSPLSSSEVIASVTETMAIADVDGNGEVDALTDGLLILRYLFGLRGEALIGNVVSNDATRTTAAAIEAYLNLYNLDNSDDNVDDSDDYTTQPTAKNDFISTNQNTAISLNVSTNDIGFEDSPINYSLLTNTDNGSVVLDINGIATYTPNSGFYGYDSFNYRVTDVNGVQSTASATVSVLSSSWPSLNSEVNQDVESTVATILSSMTTAEKVGQMVQAEIAYVTPNQAREWNLGSVLNGGGSWPNGQYSTVADWVALADSFYTASKDKSDGGAGIPLIWGTDAVHGHNNVIGATIFPHNIGLGATNNPQLMREIGEITALEVAATGIDWVFAPTLAVVRNDTWGRTYEGYSEDPEIVRAYAGEIVKGLQGEGDNLFGPANVIATAKHFVGDGGTENGIDQGNTVVSEDVLRNVHSQGYFSALEAGAQTVMASYNSWNGSKLHGSQYLLTDVLKQQMGFDGFVIGDWNGHGQVPGCSDDQCAEAIMAGVDMIMVPIAWQPLIQNTIAQIENGTIPMSRIDDAVSRILRVKMRAGYGDKVKPSERLHANNNSLIGAPAHRAVARQAVRESLVLLKNSDNILPLDRNLDVLVAGNAANDIGKQSGGWSVSWQGLTNNNNSFPGGTSIYQGIQSVVNSAGGNTRLSASGSYSGSKPDVAIVVFGEPPYAEGAGDLSNIEYQAGNKSDLALLESLKAQNIPVISIFITGRPLWVNKELNASNAFVAAWLPGSEGGGIADVIFKAANGEINHDFTGKLSFSWPKTTNQLILNRGDENYDPLFAYGFGLGYQETDTLGDNLDTTDNGNGQADIIHTVPGTIEAEQFSAMFGIQTETSTDSGGGTGGGINIGYTDVGDWLEYNIDVQTAGTYTIEYRIASWGGSNGFKTLINGSQIDQQLAPDTEGWQNWTTITAAVNLQAGSQTLRVNAIGSAWNMNWIRLTLQ